MIRMVSGNLSPKQQDHGHCIWYQHETSITARIKTEVFEVTGREDVAVDRLRSKTWP